MVVHGKNFDVYWLTVNKTKMDNFGQFYTSLLSKPKTLKQFMIIILLHRRDHCIGGKKDANKYVPHWVQRGTLT